MKRYIESFLFALLATFLVASCEDAEYTVNGTTVFLQESVNETGIAGEVTTIPADGKKVSLTIALSSQASEDITVRLATDETALATYNKEQSGEYLLMDKSLYDFIGVR